MFRRYVTIVLILGYVASQMASLSHAHGSQPAGHDERPHVHGSWITRLLGIADEATNERDASHRHHDHSHGGHSHTHDRPQAPSVPTEPANPDHDSTCIYLADGGHGALNSGTGAFFASVFHQAHFADEAVCSHLQATPIIVRQLQRPPDSLLSGCALILKLRTLRI